VTNNTPAAPTGTVSVIDGNSNAVVGTVQVGALPAFVSTAPDGTRAYVANFGSNSLSIIDTANNGVIGTVQVGNGPFGVAARP
jgi:YVTN family beta-propeller protein